MNSIKKSVLLFCLIFVFVNLSSKAYSQTKVGYIDSKRILDAMQDSKDAKLQLDNLVTQWQGELKSLQDSLRLAKDDYEKKKLILTDQLKQQTEVQIAAMETEVTNFKVQKFGENGEYFQKQTELMKPVQDRVFKAIEFVAKDGGYDYVFDRSGDIMLLYVNESYDLTLKVLNQIEGK